MEGSEMKIKNAIKKRLRKVSGKPAGSEPKPGPGEADLQKAIARKVFVKSNVTTISCKQCRGTFYVLQYGGYADVDTLICQGCGRKIDVKNNHASGNIAM